MDPQIAGLKELITQRLDGIEASMSQRFDGVDDRLEGLTVQVKETNGRLRMEEAATADFRPRVSALEREMGEEKRFIRKSVDILTAAIEEARKQIRDGLAALSVGENRSLSMRDFYLVLAGIGGTVGVIKFFGLIK